MVATKEHASQVTEEKVTPMSSIPLIALMSHTPQQPDLMQNVMQAQAIKSGMQEQQYRQNQMRMQQQEKRAQEQQFKDQSAMTAAMQSWDGKNMDELPGLVMQHGGSAQAVLGLKSHILDENKKYSDLAKTDSETGAKNLENLRGKNDLLLGGLNAAMQAPDDQLAQTVLSTSQDFLQKGILDKEHFGVVQQIIQAPPPKLRMALQTFEKGLMGQQGQIDQAQKEAQIRLSQSQADKNQWELANGPITDQNRFIQD